MTHIKEISDEGVDSSTKLFTLVKKTVGSAIFRAMQVAGKSDGSYPSKLGQQALATQSCVARSTIAKYINAKDDIDSNVNPDLKTLCRLAQALNVSPAMLLLTPDDWSRLAQAAVFLREASSNEQVKKISADMTNPTSGPSTRATAGLQLARLFGVYKDFQKIPTLDTNAPTVREDLLAEQRGAVERQRIGIFVATSIPPLRELQPSLHAPILALCANLGASIHT